MKESDLEQTKSARTQCALCGEEKPLCESHVIPAFAFRWLKEDSATGHIRFSDAPNLRVQDGERLRLLCRDCDNGRISEFEKKFSEHLFKVWHDGPRIIRYGNYLLPFTVSISWRILKYCFRKGLKANYSETQMELMRKAELRWREFLLGKQPHPAEFEQHIFLYGGVTSSTETNMPTNINRFARNSITFDIIGSEKSLYTFAKIGEFFIIGHIQPSNHLWKGTKVRLNGGEFPCRKVVLPKQLWPVFVEKAKLQEECMKRISVNQFEKIQRDIISNLDRAAASGSFRAAMADADMFGKHVIIREK